MTKSTNKINTAIKNDRLLVQLFNALGIAYMMINLFLDFLFSQQEFKYNTLRAYALTLSQFVEYCKFRGVDYLDTTDFKRWFGGLLPEFIIWMEVSEKKSQKTIYRIIKRILYFYHFYFLTLENDELFTYIVHLDKKYSRKGVLGRKAVRKLRCVKRIAYDEYAKLLAACNNLRDRIILIILCEVGLRSGELLTLRWEDLRPFENRMIVNGAPNIYTKAYAKSGYRKVAATNEIFALLEQYRRELQNNNRLSSEYVFVSRVNKPMPIRYAAIRSLLLSLTKKTGIHLHAHMFRKTCAQNMVLRRVSSKAIKDQLGHADIMTTEEHYIGPLEELASEVLQGSEGFIGGSGI